jgi:hypothetical protein
MRLLAKAFGVWALYSDIRREQAAELPSHLSGDKVHWRNIAVNVL